MPFFILGGTFGLIEWNDCAKVWVHNEPNFVVIIFHNNGVVFIPETSINLFFKNRKNDYLDPFLAAGDVIVADTFVKFDDSGTSGSNSQSTYHVFHNPLYVLNSWISKICEFIRWNQDYEEKIATILCNLMLFYCDIFDWEETVKMNPNDQKLHKKTTMT